jgi:hypothetical protein
MGAQLNRKALRLTQCCSLAIRKLQAASFAVLDPLRAS